MAQSIRHAMLLCVIVALLLLNGCGKQHVEEKGDIVIVQSVDQSKLIRPNATEQPKPAQEAQSLQHEALWVRFLNVWDGDATIVRTQGGKVLLIDCGDSRTQDFVVDELQKLGIRRLDYLILSNPLLKNIGGCSAVLKQIPADTIIANAQDSSSKPYRIFDEKAKDTAKNYTRLRQDQRMALDSGITMLLLLPYKGSPDQERIEDNSIVTLLQIKDVQLLLMGDCGKRCEGGIMDNIPASSHTLLKLADQGSKDGTTQGLINATQPDAVFISVAPNNQHNNPSRDMLLLLYNRTVPVYRTDHHGDITVRSDGQDYVIATQNRY